MSIKCPKCQHENPNDTIYCGKCAARLRPSEDIEVTETIEAPKEELTTGSTFAGRYQIIEELGKGGMGKVYRVLDKKLKEEIALKLIKPEIAKDKKTLERFHNELKLARKISQRNVGRMYELMEENGTHFITMEYVPGEDLRSLIRRIGQLPIGKSISIAKQICDGLAEAHRLGVVHRDLKSNNIMIDKEGNVRIMDFGIARSLEAKGITGPGVMIGTPEYMSPEQVEGKEVNQRSDIYSLGVILYEMVTGRVPFEGDTPFTIGVKHKSEKPKNPKEINAQIPEDLSQAILRCLEKDKEKRYPSARDVRSHLGGIEKGIPTTERVIPERKPLTSREITVTFGLRKLFIPALIFIGIIIIAVLIWQLLPQKEATVAPKIENSIAIISFENQTGDKAYDYLQKVIPNLLITNLENTGLFYVVTWERMHDLLKQIGKNDVETINRDLGFDVCRLEGIEAIVLGFFTKAGDLFHTDIKVLDTETKRILKGYISKGEGVDSILKTQIDELSREISEGIGKQKIEASQLNIRDVTTNSLEAYKYFLMGREAYWKLYDEDALEPLKKAVEIDPNFAEAHYYLADIYNSLGQIRERDEAIEKAKSLSQELTEKEKLYIDSMYARYIEHDQEKRGKILEQLVEKYPKEKYAHYRLGRYNQSRNRDKAIEEYNKTLELDPNFGLALNQLGYLYSGMENYEKAVECFKRYTVIAPDEANPLDSLADTYYFMGNLDDAILKSKEALEIKPDFYLTYTKIGYIHALKEEYAETMKWVDKFIAETPIISSKCDGYLWKGFYSYWLGSLKNCLIYMQRAVELAKNAGDKYRMAVGEFLKGAIYYDQGELDLGSKYHQNWLNVFNEAYPEFESFNRTLHIFSLGLIDIKNRKIYAAKALLAEMRSLFPEMNINTKKWAIYWHDLLNAEILLAEGFSEKAIDAFEKEFIPLSPSIQYTDYMIFSNTPFIRDELAHAYLKKGDLDKAIAEYERLITFNPTSRDRRLINPKYYYRLARLYEEKGWKGKAIEHYEKFLSLWKDADPGTAEVEDAKKRLAGLKKD